MIIKKKDSGHLSVHGERNGQERADPKLFHQPAEYPAILPGIADRNALPGLCGKRGIGSFIRRK